MKTFSTTRRVFVGATGALLMLGSALAFSPEARAMAQDLLTRAAGMSFNTDWSISQTRAIAADEPVDNAPGAISVSSGVSVDVTAEKSGTGSPVVEAQTPPKKTLAELADAGFKLPASLPDGMNFVEALMMPDQSAEVTWSNNQSQVTYTVRRIKSNDHSFNAPGGSVEEIKLARRTVALVKLGKRDGMSEYSVNEKGENKIGYGFVFGEVHVNAGGSESSAADPLIVQWTEGGMLYILLDLGGQVGRETLLAIANSVP